MSKEETKKVNVICPICRARTVVYIPTYIFHRNQNGIANIQIQSKDVCNHQFLLSIDQQFNVRGTEKIDFQVTIAPEQENATELTFGDLIARFKSYATTCLLHAIIFGYPIQIISTFLDTPTLYEHLKTLSKSFLPAAWQEGLDITQISRKDFQNLPKTREDAFVVDTKGIVINTPWTKVKMGFEENLLEKATEARAPDAQLTIVKQGIQSLKSFMESAAEIVRGKVMIFDTEMEHFLDTKVPFKRPAGFLQYLLKLFDRRCPDGKCLCEKVHLKSVDIMTKTFWS